MADDEGARRTQRRLQPSEKTRQAKKWRIDNRYSQKAMANLVGCSYVAYSNFERGQTKTMIPGTMRRLAEILAPSQVTETPAPYPDDANGAMALLAKDLRHLADVLDSPDYPKDFKIDKFVEWITFTHKELKSVLRAMGKLPEKDPEQ